MYIPVSVVVLMVLPNAVGVLNPVDVLGDADDAEVPKENGA